MLGYSGAENEDTSNRMRDADLEADFPKLQSGRYDITSDEDVGYNCVAWAVGDSRFGSTCEDKRGDTIGL